MFLNCVTDITDIANSFAANTLNNANHLKFLLSYKLNFFAIW